MLNFQVKIKQLNYSGKTNRSFKLANLQVNQQGLKNLNQELVKKLFLNKGANILSFNKGYDKIRGIKIWENIQVKYCFQGKIFQLFISFSLNQDNSLSTVNLQQELKNYEK